MSWSGVLIAGYNCLCFNCSQLAPSLLVLDKNLCCANDQDAERHSKTHFARSKTKPYFLLIELTTDQSSNPTCGGRRQVPYALAQEGPGKQGEQCHQPFAVVGAVGEAKGHNQQHDPSHNEQAKAHWHCCTAVPQQGAAQADRQTLKCW